MEAVSYHTLDRISFRKHLVSQIIDKSSLHVVYTVATCHGVRLATSVTRYPAAQTVETCEGLLGNVGPGLLGNVGPGRVAR